MARRRSDVVIGIVLVVVILFVLWSAYQFMTSPETGGVTLPGKSSGNVAVIPVRGMIAAPQPFIDELDRYVSRSDVRAIVIRIESPGGVVAAAQEMYDAIKRARDTDKPVVVSMGSIAASGGYYIALGADSILADPGTLTGSIGVLIDFPEITKLLQKIGVEFHSITSGPYKDAGAPYTAFDKKSQKYFQSIVMNTYEQFVTVVSTERHLDPDTVRALADGRVYTGVQALQHKLIDKLGNLHDAIALAGAMAGIQGTPTVIKPRQERLRLWDVLFGDAEHLVNKVMWSPLLEYRYH